MSRWQRDEARAGKWFLFILVVILLVFGQGIWSLLRLLGVVE